MSKDLVEKHLHVKPKFSGFNIDHLDRKAKKLAVDAHKAPEKSAIHKRIVKKLRVIDRKNKKDYPFLNVNVEKKYRTAMHLAGGLGECDDGDIPMKLIRDHLKGKGKKK